MRRSHRCLRWVVGLLVVQCHPLAMDAGQVPLLMPGLIFPATQKEDLTSHRGAPSGVIGKVTIGPICPSVRSGSPCADRSDRPYQTTVSILSRSGAKLGEVRSDARGRFRVSLYPGTYVLVPKVPRNHLPHAAPLRVTVKQRRFTSVTIQYDSGIR